MPVTRYDPGKHHRRSIRLRGYNYARPGAYLVTICTHRRACLFGQVVDGEMQPNAFGKIVGEEWLRTAEIRRNVLLYDYEFVVMPNHVHGIIRIVDVPTSDGSSRDDMQVTRSKVVPKERRSEVVPTFAFRRFSCGGADSTE